MGKTVWNTIDIAKTTISPGKIIVNNLLKDVGVMPMSDGCGDYDCKERYPESGKDKIINLSRYVPENLKSSLKVLKDEEPESNTAPIPTKYPSGLKLFFLSKKTAVEKAPSALIKGCKDVTAISYYSPYTVLAWMAVNVSKKRFMQLKKKLSPVAIYYAWSRDPKGNDLKAKSGDAYVIPFGNTFSLPFTNQYQVSSNVLLDADLPPITGEVLYRQMTAKSALSSI